jgi:hypothetical protein
VRIVYDTEFVDDGMCIAPLSIAMRRQDGATLYAVNDSLENLARACESAWMIENVLKWLPVEVTWGSVGGMLSASVAWDEDHPDFGFVKTVSDIADMVEDFVLERPKPQLWAYYGAYDHVFLAQLYGSMVEHPAGFPMYTMDLQHEAVMRGVDGALPPLPAETVKAVYGGVRREHDARYDAHEEEYRLEWLLGQPADGR